MPIVVGGTGLYLRWLVHGRPQTPKSEPMMAARAQEALHQVHCISSLPVSPLSSIGELSALVSVALAAVCVIYILNQRCFLIMH